MAILAAVATLAAPSLQAQEAYVSISGSGSTWSYNALDQWRRNVAQNYGITVQFAASGSSIGRNEFRAGTVDFAVSEIEYGLTDGGQVDQVPTGRNFAYMPIVAGGTAFMYNLKIGNNRVTNLRLSGENVAKIFSRQITNWSDPAIKVDNPGLTLPARPIVPVVRSDGSGTSAQFTRWMAAKYGLIWDSYCGRPNCGFTSSYPVNSGVEAKSGSQGVAGFVAQDSSEGSITYVEYSYARNAQFPVVKVLNEAGYYIEPKAPSVAVALTKATIAADLTQNLGAVYGEGAATDPRAYPLSSYSYMIIPTDTRQSFTPEKGRTLSEFAYYFLCEGQQNAEALGYSPLPVNLVKAAVAQVAKIPGTVNRISENDVANCRNPTFSPDGTNLIATTAPQPLECDRQGPTQCATGTAGAVEDTPTAGAGNTGGQGGGGGGGGGGGDAAGAGAGAGAGAAGAGAGGAAGDTAGAGAGSGTTGGLDPLTGLPITDAAIDPETGELLDPGSGTSLASNVSAVPVQVELPNDGQRILLALLCVVVLIALILGPPLVSRTLGQRRSGSS